MYEAIML